MKFHLSNKDYLVISGSIAITLLGIFLIRYSMERGPWTMVDTVDYFDVARNLVYGNGLVLTRPSGLTTPMTIHPPFYSIVIAAGAALKLNLLTFVRILNISLFTALVLTICLGTYRLTSSILLSIGLGLWVVTNRAILRNYSAALSEPLCFTLGVVSLFFLCSFLQTNKRWQMYLSGFLSGLALLTRYSGIVFLVTGFLTIIIWQKARLRTKLKDLIKYMSFSTIPIVFWLIYIRLFFSGSSPGSYEWVPEIGQAMTPFRLTFVHGLWEWLGLNLLFTTQIHSTQAIILFIVFFGLGMTSLFTFHMSIKDGVNQTFQTQFLLVGIWGIYTIASTLMLLFSYIFVKVPKPWLDERLYSPIQLGIIFTVLLSIHFCQSRIIKGGFQSIPFIATIALILTANTPAAIANAKDLHTNGEGYTNWVWQSSTVIDALQYIPFDKMIVSNDPGAILFFTGRPAIDLTPILNSTKYDELPEIVQENGVVFVLFEKRLVSQLRYIYGDEAQNYIQKLTTALRVEFKGRDGGIYYPR